MKYDRDPMEMIPKHKAGDGLKKQKITGDKRKVDSVMMTPLQQQSFAEISHHQDDFSNDINNASTNSCQIEL